MTDVDDDDLAGRGRSDLLDLVAMLRRSVRRAWERIAQQGAIIASLREQNRQLEEELAAERGVTDELQARIEDLDQSNTMACEHPCGDCAGCLYADGVHNQD
jgi:septal ring factor EnvC (AmiA/AmiB activator)